MVISCVCERKRDASRTREQDRRGSHAVCKHASVRACARAERLAAGRHGRGASHFLLGCSCKSLSSSFLAFLFLSSLTPLHPVPVFPSLPFPFSPSSFVSSIPLIPPFCLHRFSLSLLFHCPSLFGGSVPAQERALSL